MSDKPNPNKGELVVSSSLPTKRSCLVRRGLQLTHELKGPRLMNEREKKAFDLLVKECDFHYNVCKEDFLKSKEDLHYFLIDLFIHTQGLGVGHHIAVYALNYWAKKHHPDRHRIYSPLLYELSKKDQSEFLKVIGIRKD